MPVKQSLLITICLLFFSNIIHSYDYPYEYVYKSTPKELRGIFYSGLPGGKILYLGKDRHDRYLIEGLENQTKAINESVRFGIKVAKDRITDDNLNWLKSLPISLAIKVDNLSILCCHGSPWNPINGYIYEDSDLFSKMQDFKYDIIALGHTHRQYLNLGNPIVFNPGSLGQSRDREGIACAKILCTTTAKFEHIYLNYDYQKEINFSLNCGAKKWIYKHFKTLPFMI